MAINLTVNGVSYSYPQTGDANWGTGATGWAQAVTSGMLSLSGGSFSLTSQVDFGLNFGIKSLYILSETALPALSGVIRLANADSIAFRNLTNSADLLFKPGAIDGALVYSVNNILLTSNAFAAGAVPYSTSTGISFLAPGSPGQVYTSNGAGVPTWGSALTNPMTSVGDLIIGGTAGAATRLAGNITATKLFLTQTGTGTVSTAQVYAAILAVDVPVLNQSTSGNALTATSATTAATATSLTGTNVVTNANLSQAATLTIKGNNTAGLANVSDLTAAQVVAMLPIPSKKYYSGFQQNTAVWSTASTTFVDPASTGAAPTLTQRQGSLVVATAASNLPGITFTPAASASIYKITAAFCLQNAAGAAASALMTDGTTAICQGSLYNAAVTAGITTLTGVFVPGTSSPVTVKLQLATTASTAVIQAFGITSTPSIEWTVLQIA